MDNTPFFSVIIPAYNREKYIVKAIDSLRNQTFTDFETIIVDDCSTDKTYLLALNHPLQNKRVIKNTTNSERCVTRNNGISIAKGQYICFLDSDDYHLDNHLEELYNQINNQNFTKGVFFTNAWDESESGVRRERVCPELKGFDVFSYILNFTPNPQRWAIHRDIFETLSFDENVVVCEDMDLLLRIAAKGLPFYQLNKRTTVYVASKDSFTHGDINKAEKELKYYKIIFSKKELKCFLTKKDCNRLLSKCYFFLNVKYKGKRPFKSIFYGIYSFLLFPKGYNGKTNKILLVNILYSLPILGCLLKKSIQLAK